MCYTTDEYVRPKSEVTYNAQFPYGSDGYRTDCNNIPVSFLADINDHTRDMQLNIAVSWKVVGKKKRKSACDNSERYCE